jgi:hypothetical protein
MFLSDHEKDKPSPEADKWNATLFFLETIKLYLYGNGWWVFSFKKKDVHVLGVEEELRWFCGYFPGR